MLADASRMKTFPVSTFLMVLDLFKITTNNNTESGFWQCQM
jgi:hypothetical protein